MADIAHSPGTVVPHSPDPAIPIDEVAESSPEMDFPAHIRTFNAVLSMARWFVIHLFILLVALYFFAIAGDPVTGALLICCSIALLVYGALRRPSIRADLAKAAGAAPAASEAQHVDPAPGEGDRTA